MITYKNTLTIWKDQDQFYVDQLVIQVSLVHDRWWLVQQDRKFFVDFPESKQKRQIIQETVAQCY